MNLAEVSKACCGGCGDQFLINEGMLTHREEGHIEFLCNQCLVSWD
jgi:hypothetical protein